MFRARTILAILMLCLTASACTKSAARTERYAWQNISAQAAFPEGYNYPVFVLGGEMLALNNGGWLSTDGRNWTKTALAESGLNSAYQKYVQFRGAIYALGAIDGNYLGFKISPKILRTQDGVTWETLAEKSNLPARIFYGAVAFRDKIWLVGGYDGKNYYHDVWNSPDGVNWTRATENAAWSPRNATRLVVFRDRLWLIGGGVIDGEKTNNPASENEIWSSADGVEWTRAKTSGVAKLAGTPVVFDDKLWLVGANRNDGDFASAVLVSADGAEWQERSAPWSPRGGAVAWVFGGRLFMTGGKYSFVERGATRFVYSRDVWAMGRK